MKVLDMSSGDGYIARWLQQQFPHAEITHDGVGNGRTYDAVVAVDRLDQVTDPNVFLAGLEATLNPDGRIYLAVPDGATGAGNYPGRRRVYRRQDLADLLRRRGRIISIHSDDDTTMACYTPRERHGHIVIHTAGGWQRWHPIDVAKKGLGGSETAATRLTESLSELGWVVTVYGEVDDTLWGDAMFHHHSRWDPAERCDLFIASRAPTLVDVPINAAVRALWVHDVDCGDQLTPGRADRFDHLLALSDWQRRHLRGRYPFAKAKIRRFRNGILPELFAPAPWTDRPPRVLYTSSPDRGLDVVLELWSEIKARVPDAELAFCYPDVYDAVADQVPEIREHRDRIRALSDQPGVVRMGSLPQPTLAKLMSASRVWVHPSWMTAMDEPFMETSCIGAMEAQAAGCHVVAGGWGALRETVRHGHLLTVGDPRDARWREGFITSVVEGLTNQATGDLAVLRGPEAAKRMSWDLVARDLVKLTLGQI